jgi:hypothetical protein
MVIVIRLAVDGDYLLMLCHIFLYHNK